MTFRFLFYDRSVDTMVIEPFEGSARRSLSNPNLESSHLRKRGYSASAANVAQSGGQSLA